MNFTILPIDFTLKTHLHAFLKWERDEELNALTIPKMSADIPPKNSTEEELLERFLSHEAFRDGTFIIAVEDQLVGFLSIQMNPTHLVKNEPSTAWLGLTIGERKYWGSGAAQFAMEFFEKEARLRGAQRVELGTFAFNHRAQKFYQKLGYIEFSRIKNFTHLNGQVFDDIRMEKYL